LKSQKVKISEVKINPSNPRLIRDDKFLKLVNSVKEFPEMLEIRPIVVNKDMMVLGGNMRLKACKEAGLKEVPVIIADNLTEQQQKEFLIKDNVSGGEWAWEILANEWEAEQLEEWGLDIDEKIIVDGKEIEINQEFDPAQELGIEKEYLMIVFENKDQHNEAIDFFELKTQREVNNKKIELNNIGIQRVIKYEDLRSVIK